MIRRTALYLILMFLCCLCIENKESIQSNTCTSIPLDQSLDYEALIKAIDPTILTAVVEEPNASGALGRNKTSYIHARFQMDMTKLLDYGMVYEDESAIQALLSAISYAFNYQNESGDFAFVAPEDLINAPDYIKPSEGDLASATAFFSYSLGLSLVSLDVSIWYQEGSFGDIRDSLTVLNPKIQLLLDNLKNNELLLKTYDREAPNRLLFDAVAFYTLGQYLNDGDAIRTAIDFANAALLQRDTDAGYFIEAGGWDSSYNGVAIKIGLELYALLDDDHLELRGELGDALSCAIAWQATRINTGGEISKEGNTRVYDGGEVFLGTEKEIDVEKTIKAFNYYATLSEDESYRELSERIISYYF